MEWLDNALDFIVQQVLAEFITVVAGIGFVYLIQNRWVEWRFGKWRVVITDETGKQVLDRKVSADKIREIMKEPAEKAVFLKGVVSPYGTLNCDIIEKGPELGLLDEDQLKRLFVVDLRKNPAPKKQAAQPEKIRKKK
jgi:hypothetical protein